MATPTNRSPSPILTKPNPNLRNSETNSTMRRSFSGNPFARPSLLTNPRSFNHPTTTPANSPADLGRRKSMGKEGMISSYEEKENENTKAARVRSPAKSTKNFMSPTISAASKFTSSPRKKVLAEKNDSVRTSISFSGDKISFTKDTESDLKSQMGFDQNKVAGVQQNNVLEDTCPPQVPSKNSALREETCFDVLSTNSALKEETCFDVPSTNSALKEDACVEVPSNSMNPSESLSDLTASVDCDKIQSNQKNNIHSCSSASPAAIAPLDDDPSLPPYDPTTNYLSPRPLFLRYKPNPRVEVFLNKQVLDFEGSLISELLSDTEETQSEESLKESDDSSSVEMEPNTEPLLVSETIHQHTCVPKIAFKPKFFTRSKSISLLLVFLVACLCISVTDSPVIGSPVLGPTFYHPFEAVEFAKANFDGVVRNFKQWASNSISYLSKNHFSEEDEFSPSRFSNTSASHEDLLVDGYFNGKLNENQEQNGLENVIEEEAEIEPLVEEQGEPGIQEVEPIIRAELSDSRRSVDALEAQQSDDESHDDEDLQRLERIVEDQLGLDLQARELKVEAAAIELEVVKSDDLQGENENDLIRPNEFESNLEEHLNSEISTEMVDPEVVDTPLQGSEEKFLALNVLGLGVSTLALGLVLGSIFIYTKQSKASTNVVVDVVEPSSSVKKIYEEKTTSRNLQTEVDELSSCPSEMSSFQKSVSYSKKEMRETTEAQSQERRSRKNYKRESLTSSDFSMGSPSYGSFTTYERIPKHGSEDEEIVTPVRRSSRIRSHVTSS